MAQAQGGISGQALLGGDATHAATAQLSDPKSPMFPNYGSAGDKTAKSGGGASPSFYASTFRPLVGVLVLLVFMYLGMSVTLSVTPGIITNSFSADFTADGQPLSCGQYQPQDKPEACTEAAAKAAFLSSVMSAVSAAVAFVTAPTLGALSDTYGRRPLLVFTAVVATLPKFAFALFAKGYVPVGVYYVTMGASLVSPGVSVALAYVADIVPPSYRAAASGLVTAAFSVTFTVGPILSSSLSFDTVLGISMATPIVAIFVAVVGVKESLDSDARVEFTRDKLNPFANLAILTRSTLFMLIGLTVVFNSACTDGVRDLLLYFLMDVYNLNPNSLAMVLITVGVSCFIVQGFLIRPLKAVLPYKGLLLLGIGASLLDMVLFIAVKSELSVYLQMGLLLSLGQVTFPAVCAISSLHVSEHEQGTVQGALYGVQQLGGGIGPLAFTAVFRAFTHKGGSLPFYPQAPFVLGAVLTVGAVIMVAIMPRPEDDLAPVQADDATFNAAHEKHRRLSVASEASQSQLLADSSQSGMPSVV